MPNELNLPLWHHCCIGSNILNITFSVLATEMNTALAVKYSLTAFDSRVVPVISSF
jgi:hypothetical protein